MTLASCVVRTAADAPMTRAPMLSAKLCRALGDRPRKPTCLCSERGPKERTPLFRFSLMVIRPDNDPGLRRTSTTWSALKGEPLISLVRDNLVRDFIDKHLARSHVVVHPRATFNHLDTMIAMVEASEGVAIIPSFALPACRNRKVAMSKLINPVVNVDFCRISLRGKKFPPGADDFTAFLQGYIARWAGRAGIL
jgi:LysR family transcriptional regulator, carnitine catabolism transcriptional activator